MKIKVYCPKRDHAKAFHFGGHAMTRNRSSYAALLLGAICFLGCDANATPVKQPEKLLRVTLYCDKGTFSVMPLWCLGADVVNLGGRSVDAVNGKVHRLTLQCLSGAVVGIVSEEGRRICYLVVTSEDDGKMIRLRFDQDILYKDEVPCWIDMADAMDPGKGKDHKSLEERKAKCLEALGTMKNTLPGQGCGVGIGFSDSFIPVLRELKGSGVGIAFCGDVNDKTRKVISKEFLRAVGEAKARQLMMDCRGLADLRGDLPAVESLLLAVPPGESLPDLSGLTNLRHLYVISFGPGCQIDAKALEHLVRLRSLTLLATNIHNIDAIGLLSEVQFLVVLTDLDSRREKVSLQGDLSFLNRLGCVQYLAAGFPTDAGFEFAEHMPYLQTLCILNLDKSHDLTRLVKLPHLRCLALEDDPKNTSPEKIRQVRLHLEQFQKARPDVEVVQYKGMCLGSFWLLPLTVVAGIVAWVFRRRGRLSRWQ
jgi:hypothetical protein